MGDRDGLLAAALQIHEAGLDAAKWPAALNAMTSLLGGWCALLQVVDLPSRRCSGTHSFNMPASQLDDYTAHYAMVSPRLPYLQRQAPGALCWDYQFIDERSIGRHPFYMEFLMPWDMRYCLGGIVENARGRMAFAAVQRSSKQGHPTRAGIDLMAALMPHLRLAYDVNRRLDMQSDRQNGLEHLLDWLVDGVLMLAADGGVLYANGAAQEIMRRDNGIGLRGGALAFRSAGAAAKFDRALDAARRMLDIEATAPADTDFILEQQEPNLPLAVSLRPMPRQAGEAAVLMFICDPLNRGSAVTQVLRDAFGLTPAEGDLAAALCAGASADDYARARGLSRNTVYTHLQRLKYKTGCTRLAALIRKLNDAQPAMVRRRL